MPKWRNWRYAHDSKSCARKGVWVRLPPSAPPLDFQSFRIRVWDCAMRATAVRAQRMRRIPRGVSAARGHDTNRLTSGRRKERPSPGQRRARGTDHRGMSNFGVRFREETGGPFAERLRFHDEPVRTVTENSEAGADHDEIDARAGDRRTSRAARVPQDPARGLALRRNIGVRRAPGCRHSIVLLRGREMEFAHGGGVRGAGPAVRGRDSGRGVQGRTGGRCPGWSARGASAPTRLPPSPRR